MSKRTKRIFFSAMLCMAITELSVSTKAESPKIDFDQGFSIPSVLCVVKEASEREISKDSSINAGPARLLPFRDATELPIKLERLQISRPSRDLKVFGQSSKACKGAPESPCSIVPPLSYCRAPAGVLEPLTKEKGHILGSFVKMILESAIFAEALPYPAQLRQIPPQQGAPLLKAWDAILKTRGGLLNEAAPLDKEDEKLYDDYIVIRKLKDNLERRRVELRKQADDYYRICGSEKPPDYCAEWMRRYNDCVSGAHEYEVECTNVRIAKWREDYGRIDEGGKALKKKKADWEEHEIKPFIESAEKALQDAGMTSVVVQAQGGGLQKSVKMNVLRPVTLGEGLIMLDQLWAQLTARERASRNRAIELARNYMRVAAAVGGIQAPPPVSKPFHNPDVNPSDARIDVVVYRGHAFVPIDSIDE